MSKKQFENCMEVNLTIRLTMSPTSCRRAFGKLAFDIKRWLMMVAP